MPKTSSIRPDVSIKHRLVADTDKTQGNSWYRARNASRVQKSQITSLVACDWPISLDFQSPANYGHDPHTCKNHSRRSVGLKARNGNSRTDTTDCITFPASAVGNGDTGILIKLGRLTVCVKFFWLYLTPLVAPPPPLRCFIPVDS